MVFLSGIIAAPILLQGLLCDLLISEACLRVAAGGFLFSSTARQPSALNWGRFSAASNPEGKRELRRLSPTKISSGHLQFSSRNDRRRARDTTDKVVNRTPRVS